MSQIINISLVGGQSMPVHIGLSTDKPQKVFLVHSSQSAEEAKRIRSICGIDSELVEFPLDDYSCIQTKAKTLLTSLSNCHVCVNVSSGTKHWAVAFSMLSVNMDNVSIYYIDQNNIYHDLTHGSSSKLDLSLDLETLLRYNNHTGQTHVSLADYTREDQEVLKATKRLRYEHSKEFNALALTGKDKDWKKQLAESPCPRKKLQYPLQGEVEYDKFNSVVTFCFYDKDGSLHQTRLSSPHVGDIVFNAGWFEYEVAKMLSQWSGAKEVWLNVRFPYIDGYVKNEIDIIVNVGNKLLFVECKTNIYDNTDIDKFRTAVKNYGGMGSKALFVTQRMTAFADEKCRDCGIIPFYFSSRKGKGQRFLLYSILEKELKIINKR